MSVFNTEFQNQCGSLSFTILDDGCWVPSSNQTALLNSIRMLFGSGHNTLQTTTGSTDLNDPQTGSLFGLLTRAAGRDTATFTATPTSHHTKPVYTPLIQRGSRRIESSQTPHVIACNVSHCFTTPHHTTSHQPVRFH